MNNIKISLYLEEQHRESVKLWSAIIRNNTYEIVP